jgi:regulator of sirC expression with transglutaminase-like and TPR domain
LAKALSSYKKQIDAQEGLFRFNLGVIAVVSKDFDSAIAQFENSLRLNPKEPESYYSLGLLYEAYKLNPAKAIKNYEGFLKYSDNEKRKENVKERIERLILTF